jgi:putative peptide zinc metalloprotease protein
VPERPALAPDVELIGELRDTAFRDSQWLIARAGTFIQVSEPVYRMAEYADGERTLEDIAGAFTDSTRWAATADDVREVIATRLLPLSLVTAGADAAGPRRDPGHSAPSPLLLNMRTKVLGPRFLDPATFVLRFLHAPVVLVPALVAVVAAHAWLYGQHGLSAVLRDVAYTPGSLAGVVALYVASGLFHELGHASALRYGGGRARSIGVGVYLMYPAFYTDTTESYRLGRWGRVRTDLGGFYFHLLCSLAIVALYLATGREWLLLTVVLIDFDIARQLFPFVRFDGYWALTDLLGVPDVLSHMKSALTRGLPGRRGTSVPALKPWAGAVFAGYTLVTVPLLAVLLVLLLVRGPLMLPALWNALLIAEDQVVRDWTAAQLLPGAMAALQLALLAVQAVGLLYLFYAVGRQLLQGLWRWSKPRRGRRIGGAAVSGVAIGLLVSYWISSLGMTFVGAPDGVQTFQVSQRMHVPGSVLYAQSPPVGGPHSPVWQNCGFYSTPVASEHAVHSMEHGAVWITYRPDLPDSQVAALRELAVKQSYVLVSPYPDDLPAPVVASAWGRQLRLSSADDPRLDQFVRVFRLGPQAPERGGRCAGGASAPER